MKTKLFFTAQLILIIFLVNGCGKGSSSQTTADPCAGLSFKFATDVQPIINSTCANSSNCHGAASANVGGPLTDYNKIFNKRAEMKIQLQAGLMPQTGSITADQKNKIICWVNSGAPNN